MNYFTGITDLNELKKAYKKLALKFHPDRGGDLETMQLINLQYETLSKELINGNTEFTDEQKDFEASFSTELVNKINEIITIQGIDIEVIGSWIWITGNTYPVKDQIKKASFKFAKKKVAWFWHFGEYRKTSRKNYNLDELRTSFGSEKVESKYQLQLS